MIDSSTRPIRILIVDRSEAFLAGAGGWIADRPGLAVVGTAGNGPEGLEAVDRLQPDLVLVDGVLPGLDGFRFVRALKQRARPPLAIVTTFLATAAARDAAYEAGADGFLAKDDFAGAFELLLDELLDEGAPGAGRPVTPKRSARRESRIEPGP